MANQDLKENVLLNLRSVTQSCKGGVPFERLQRDYRDLLGSSIPFRELGYNSLEAFIKDIPDVISLRRNGEGQLMAEGVADASTAHIVSLVQRQKSDTKKRIFRKPPPHGGMRKTLTSRYTFREGPRGTHSHYISPATNQTSKTRSRSPKSKPSKPSTSAPHSKSRAPPEQVPSRKYEVAPRFLKLKEMKYDASLSQELTLPPPPQSAQSSFNSSLNNSEVIPPPRAVGRSLPIKPVGNYRTHHLNDLASARTAKEFVEIYAKMNDLTPVYRTVLFGQKAKGFVSTLKLNDKSYQSYPDMKPTEELAEEEAAKKAQAAIKEQKESLSTLPETPCSNADDIRILLGRIEEIVREKPSGMFAYGIVREFEGNFNARLPACWPELLKQSSYLEIEETHVQFGKIPEGADFIVRPTKELSSGNQTPSSTSSKTEFALEDFDTKTLQKTLVDISLPKVSELVIPTGNAWDVYITYVSGWFSARLLDYSDEFLALSDEMSLFYKTHSLPVAEVFESQVYATCIEDIWHRVIVEEVKEDGKISCYFVDEGDFAYVTKEKLQEMNPSFLKLPYQAIQLALYGLDEYEKCIRNDVLETYLLGKTLIAEVKRWYNIPEFFPDISGIHRTVYSVILYDTSNSSEEDLNLNEILKKSAIESLSCKLPKLSTSSCAYLSHVTPEGLVYLRLTNPQQCWIEQELDRLSPVFEKTSTTTREIPHHKMCAAKYESGTWHRAVVSESLQSADPELVEVFFVDFGHISVVGKSEICELKPISDLLASIPHQAICCELLNALPTPKSRWTEKATDKLLELAPFDQELIIRVMSDEVENSLAKVNLHKRNEDSNIISINDTLACNPSLFDNEKPVSFPPKTPTMLPLKPNPRKSSLKSNLSGIIPDVAIPAEEQMARRLVTSMSSENIEWINTPDNIKSPDAFEVYSPASISLPPVPDKGGCFDVFVTMAAHPHNFVIQPLDSCNELDTLMKEMKSCYSLKENWFDMDFSMLKKNAYYAGLHSDNQWYRVRIEQIINDNPVLVAVHYVDFGDFNTIGIDKLQPLYQKFRQLPCQAIKASLAGIKPFDTDWHPVHCHTFQGMVTEKPFVSVIHKKHKDIKDEIPSLHLELTLIDTTDTSKDVYIHELLVEKKIAKLQ